MTGYTEQDIFFFVYTGASVSWIIRVNKFQFFTISRKLCNEQILIIYH